MLRVRAALAACGLLLGAAACSSSDGRELPPPKAGVTAPPVTVTTSGAAFESSATFALSSPAVHEGGVLPDRHTCFGENMSPALSWSAPPPTASFALVVRDETAEGFVHWVVTGIDPVAIGFGEGGVPEGAVEAANSAGTLGWYGPCPLAGDPSHTYVFTLFAVPEPLTLDPSIPAAEAAGLVEAAASDRAHLRVTVSPPPVPAPDR